jgi:hypothetical protein
MLFGQFRIHMSEIHKSALPGCTHRLFKQLCSTDDTCMYACVHVGRPMHAQTGGSTGGFRAPNYLPCSTCATAAPMGARPRPSPSLRGCHLRLWTSRSSPLFWSTSLMLHPTLGPRPDPSSSFTSNTCKEGQYYIGPTPQLRVCAKLK